MTKKISTAIEAHLKARKTSLGKKSQEELINLILRKDKTERKLNSKINKLNAIITDKSILLNDIQDEYDENTVTITELNNCINEYKKQINHLTNKNLSLKTYIKRMYYVIIILSALLVCVSWYFYNI